jgi:fatty acid desaturase
LLCVATIPAHISIYLLLGIYFNSIPLPILFLLPLCFVFLGLQNAGANHNHYHTPVFRQRWANNILTILYSIASGRPKTPYNISHGLHHDDPDSVNHLRVRDILGLTKPASIAKGFALQYLNAFCFEFFIYWWLINKLTLEIIKAKYRGEAGRVLAIVKANPALFRQTKAEIIAVTIWNIVLCSINYKFFLCCYIPSQFLAGYVRRLENFVQHYGSPDPDDPKRDSVSCYDRFYNLWTFNLGYHQEHHLRRGVHWLKLPNMTAELPSDRRTVPFNHYLNLPFFFPLKNQKPPPTHSGGSENPREIAS